MDQLNKHGLALNGSKILVLGVAYKPDIDDLRESPALDIIGLLKEKKALVSYHDPFVPKVDHDNWVLESVPDLLKSVADSDMVVIITNHSEYDFKNIVDQAKLIFDTRDATRDFGRKSGKVEFL
jgi:UDP-N-acetyl-D-glucosamine dehydrogenase